MPRIFFAVALPENIKAELEELQGKMRYDHAPVKWVLGKNMHITLLFLGEISRQLVDKHVQAVREAAFSVPPFIAQLGGVGVFPQKGSPRVIWSGLQKGSREMAALAKELSMVLDIRPDKPFTPHITLGRVRTGQKFAVEPEKWSDFKTPEFQVDSFHCLESTLTPGGPIYSTVASFALKKN